MDRNKKMFDEIMQGNPVALRKESVDRNPMTPFRQEPATVALRKESVDRNLLWGCCDSVFERSLSARRAWIEILLMWYQCNTVVVALRKESVDRNIGASYGRTAKMVSLSARRAWIEISAICCLAVVSLVALRKESVDRNREYCSNT